MSSNAGQYRKNIVIGSKVGVTTRENRNSIIKGIVKKHLTRSDYHTHGIMVELEDGTIGRVKEINSVVDLNNNSTESIHVDTFKNEDPLDENRSPIETSFSINEDDTGFSYKNLFFPYLNGANKVTLEDAYIRLEYQIKNLVFFCTLLSEQNKGVNFILKTSSDDRYKKQDQIRKFEELKSTLEEMSINFVYEFDEALHDRSIQTDTGWKIILGRGLDFFKDPGSYYSPANFDQTKRKCKKTDITFIRNSNG